MAFLPKIISILQYAQQVLDPPIEVDSVPDGAFPREDTSQPLEEPPVVTKEEPSVVLGRGLTLPEVMSWVDGQTPTTLARVQEKVSLRLEALTGASEVKVIDRPFNSDTLSGDKFGKNLALYLPAKFLQPGDRILEMSKPILILTAEECVDGQILLRLKGDPTPIGARLSPSMLTPTQPSRSLVTTASRVGGMAP